MITFTGQSPEFDSLVSRLEAVELAQHALGARVLALETTPPPTKEPEPEPEPQPVPSDVTLFRYTGAEEDYHGEHSSTAHGLEVVPAPGYPDRKAMQYLLKPGDPRWHGGGYRAETHSNYYIADGEEHVMGFALRLDQGYDQGTNSTWDDHLIYQFADEGSPAFSIHLDPEKNRLWVRRKRPEGSSSKFSTLGEFSLNDRIGTWIDGQILYRASKGTDGKFAVWLNGREVCSFEGLTLPARSRVYAKWGIYGQPTKLLYGEHRLVKGGLDRLVDVDTHWR